MKFLLSRRLCKLIGVVLFCSSMVRAQGTITTVAGSSANGGYSGDGGLATNAGLFLPRGVAVDAAGNVYIADSNNNRVRKVTPAGIITTMAGNGQFNSSGDGGPATSAGIVQPYALALDAAGNLYIADYGNFRIRKVSAAGTISTVAGGGTGGGSGDGGPATSANLNRPYAVAVDTAGNVYFSEYTTNRIRKVTPGGIISTVAGNGGTGFSGDGGPATSAQLNTPWGVAVDSAGNLYIADNQNNRIRKVNTSGIISTVAGNGNIGFSGEGGPATSAQLSGPRGVMVDAAGNLYIGDSFNHCIRKITPGGIISTVAGVGGHPGFSGDNGPATSAQFTYPEGMALDTAGNLYIADSTNQRVRKVSVQPPYEPRLTKNLAPGFYILEATLQAGAASGFWGMEVLTSKGSAAGGFNLGGAMYPASANQPAFGAFALSSNQTVVATLSAQLPTGATLTMRFLDSNRNQIGANVSGSSPLTLSQSLAPGFYIIEVNSTASSSPTFQLGLAADFFSGGVDTGGFLGGTVVGFGAFYVPEQQDVTMKLYGATTYGAAGAGSMALTLKDANRSVIATNP